MKNRGRILCTAVPFVLSMVVLAGCASPTASEKLPVETAQTQEDPVPTMTPEEATEKLFLAAASNDVEWATEALENSPQLETRDEYERTPLVVAVKARSIEVAKLLLDAGADPNAKDELQDSAFLYAGAEGIDEILIETLKHGADVTSTNRYGGTALIPASEHGFVSTVKILLEAGVPVNHINNLGWTALHEAIVLGTGSAEHVETVRLLIEGGADVTIPDGDGVSPRDLASSWGYSEIVALIDAAS